MAGKPDTVKVGSVSIPIYTNARGRYRSYTVAFYRDGRRQRRTFSDKEEAVSEARIVATTISNGHAQALDLTTSDREAFQRANEKLAEFGVTLDEAIREFIEAKRLLKGQPLAPAADTYARLFNGVSKGATEPTIVKECLKAKTEYGLSKRYLKQPDSDLTRFGTQFPRGDCHDFSHAYGPVAAVFGSLEPIKEQLHLQPSDVFPLCAEARFPAEKLAHRGRPS